MLHLTLNFCHFRLWFSWLVQHSRRVGHSYDPPGFTCWQKAQRIGKARHDHYQNLWYTIFLPSMTWNTFVWAVTLVRRSLSANLMEFFYVIPVKYICYCMCFCKAWCQRSAVAGSKVSKGCMLLCIRKLWKLFQTRKSLIVLTCTALKKRRTPVWSSRLYMQTKG
jgi:hypothetical protein